MSEIQSLLHSETAIRVFAAAIRPAAGVQCRRPTFDASYSRRLALCTRYAIVSSCSAI